MLRKIACLFALVAPLPALPVFIGTNTGKNTASKGIYHADFSPETGQLTEPRLAAEYLNPGFLAIHPTKNILLSIGSPKVPFPDGTSSVAAFSIAADYSLKFLGVRLPQAAKEPAILPWIRPAAQWRWRVMAMAGFLPSALTHMEYLKKSWRSFPIMAPVPTQAAKMAPTPMAFISTRRAPVFSSRIWGSTKCWCIRSIH